jgi:hypothetical protein
VCDERDEKLRGGLLFSLGLGVRVTMAARPRAPPLARPYGICCSAIFSPRRYAVQGLLRSTSAAGSASSMMQCHGQGRMSICCPARADTKMVCSDMIQGSTRFLTHLQRPRHA